MKRDDFETFVRGYLTCALWASTDESNESGGNPLDDNYGPEDFTRAAIRSARRDCRGFLGLPEVADTLATVGTWEQHGHDFWLTRNRHGAGFWDRGYDTKIGDMLTKWAQAYGDSNVYIHRKRLVFS